MAEPNGTAEGVAAAHSGEVAADKGKGKATEPTQVQDVTMGEELSESDEESADEVEANPEVEEDDDDNMEEIDTENIISGGRRTRGKQIDYEEAERKAREDGINLDEDDEDDEDDDDFEEEDDDDMKE
ncbi:hypothetical protein UCRPC4_g00373 [Phaeomoniella chlamydospora]|uniref:Histone chaperone domain-containing protein n=1 Tax=Phaeomoniella chlamydospora TaxID=158046 RepID=A0A0G2F3M0_PHACM|nr:hypothetical protein UCRPC4_g00373 [Phaeomoniella chlamydospora]